MIGLRYLRGLAAILSISRDTCIIVAIASQNCFVLVFVGYRKIIARYVAKWGITQMCLCETKYQGRGIAPFWGAANLPEEGSRDMGYRSDSIAISRDMEPLSKILGGAKRIFLVSGEDLGCILGRILGIRGVCLHGAQEIARQNQKRQKYSGVVRGLLQGISMGWGVGEELTKS